MSTQEREAMERLVSFIRATSEYDLYGDDSLCLLFHQKASSLVDHIEARHARSLQPITVEGLVERFRFVQIKGAPAGALTNGLLEYWHGESWRITEKAAKSRHGWNLPQCLWPDNELDLEHLIERLSR